MFFLQFEVQILSKKLAEHLKYMIQRPKADVSAMVIAPMPGMVKSGGVKVGDTVSFSFIIKLSILSVNS